MADKSFSVLAQLSLNSADFKAGLNAVKGNVKDLMLGVEGANGNLGEMRRALMALKNVSFAGKSIEEIAAINRQIGNLTDEMADLRAVQKSMGTEFGSVLAKSLQGITAIGEVAVGVASLFGVSKESAQKFQQTMVTLINVSQAFATIQSLIEERTLLILAAKAKNIVLTTADTVAAWANTTATAANATAIQAQTVITSKASIATKAAAAAQWLWNAAILANPITWIVLAVAALTTGIILLVRAQKSNTEEIRKQSQEYTYLESKINGVNEQYKDRLKILNAKGASEVKLLRAELDGYEKEFKNNEILLDQLNKISKKSDKQKKDAEELYIRQRELTGQAGLIAITKLKLFRAEDEAAKAAIENSDKSKKGYELITAEISELDGKIKDIAATGGIVTPQMLNDLGELYKRQKAVDDELKVYQDIIEGKNKRIEVPKKAITPKVSSIIIDSKISLKGIQEATKEASVAINEYKEKTKTELENYLNDINQITTIGINRLGASISQAFANMITGEEGSGFKEMFKGILATVGEFITQMGAAIMAYGTAMEAFKKGFKNPYVAIIAGAALMIAGGVVSNLANKIGEEDNGYAFGGIVPGLSYSGDKVPIMANSGEMILNTGQQRNLFSLLNTGNIGSPMGGEVLIKFQNGSLEGYLNYNQRKNNSIR